VVTLDEVLGICDNKDNEEALKKLLEATRGGVNMRHAKAKKYEVGRNRPTENRASNAMLNESINEWVNKVRDAGKMQEGDGVQSIGDRVAGVLVNLIGEIKAGRIQREVISGVVERLGLHNSLIKAQEILERRK